jgi:hypothetical protein
MKLNVKYRCEIFVTKVKDHVKVVIFLTAKKRKPPEPVFVNAQESIPRNRFRQPM